jgi:hypothetical protein
LRAEADFDLDLDNYDDSYSEFIVNSDSNAKFAHVIAPSIEQCFRLKMRQSNHTVFLLLYESGDIMKSSNNEILKCRIFLLCMCVCAWVCTYVHRNQYCL